MPENFGHTAICGGGILAKPGSTKNYGYRPANEATWRAIDAMVELCRRHGTDLATADFSGT